MSQHENAPKEFVNTFNAAWDIGIRSSIMIGIVLLAMFFYNLYDSFMAFFVTLILVVIGYGVWKLFAALFIGPADPDAEDDHGHS